MPDLIKTARPVVFSSRGRENLVATDCGILQIEAVRKRPIFISVSILCLIAAGAFFWLRVPKPEGRYVNAESGSEMNFRSTGFLTLATSGEQIIHKWEIKSLTDIQEWMEQARVQRLEDLKKDIANRDALLRLEKQRLEYSTDPPVAGFQEAIKAGDESERKLAEFSEISGEEFFFPDPKVKRRNVIVIAEKGLVGWHFMGTAILEGKTVIITATGKRFEKVK